jgi:type III restriction enzyme
VIRVDSGQSGAEEDEMTTKLLEVEKEGNPVEIVVHVNKLKEAWDVTNLYTIIPLRAANARTLVEQSIGRGLRLPYGKRTGNEAVDRLTIVAHDKFQEIVDDARREDSPLKEVFTTIELGDGEPAMQAVTVQPVFVQRLVGSGDQSAQPATVTAGGMVGRAPTPAEPVLFTAPQDQAAVRATLEVLAETRTRQGQALLEPAGQQFIVNRVQAKLLGAAGTGEQMLGGLADEGVQRVVETVTRAYVEQSIEMPRITLMPKHTGSGQMEYRPFDLVPPSRPYTPVEHAILVQYLENDERHIVGGRQMLIEAAPENYLLAGLADLDDVDYLKHGEFLRKLCRQMVDHLRGQLAGDEEKLHNVLQYHRAALVGEIHEQLVAHEIDTVTDYEVTVGLNTVSLSSAAGGDAGGLSQERAGRTAQGDCVQRVREVPLPVAKV